MMTILRVSGIFGALAMVAGPFSATARPVATVRVISCDAGDCLLVRGHRTSSQAVVRMNERPVDVSGRTSWQVRLPVATVRDWSAPYARTLRVAVVGAAGSVEDSGAVRLPVGLLGGKLELASLSVHAR